MKTKIPPTLNLDPENMKTKYNLSPNMASKVLMAGAAFFLSALSLSAQPEATPIVLDDPFMRDIKILTYIMVFIAIVITYIAVILSVKDTKTLSLIYIWEGIIGRNAPDPATDHEYDGIRELDNPMPAWLRLIFYATIAFAPLYLLHYHVFQTGALSKEEYEIEMALAAETYKSVELPEDQLIQITDPGRLTTAQSVFMENCATCHRNDLGGESGPNLTDEYWLHGGDVKAIYATITNGVPGKTMISWKDRIPSQQRLEIASFILSKAGSNPANPKAPEGTIAGSTDQAPTPSVQDSAVTDTSVTQ